MLKHISPESVQKTKQPNKMENPLKNMNSFRCNKWAKNTKTLKD